MKRLNFIVTGCLVGSLLIGCHSMEKVIERPAFGVRNSTTLEIDKIVRNDTATIFYVDATYYPKYWIRVDSAAYLLADGKKYKIMGGEGIKLNNYHWMPESGKSSFKLLFPVLPRAVKRVDFIECEGERAFNFWDVELNSTVPITKLELPEVLKKMQVSEKEGLPESELKMGNTRLNVHLLNFRQGMDKVPLLIYFNELLTGRQREYEKEMGEDGVYRFEFDQYGTCHTSIVYNQRGCDVILAPGDNVDLYIDMGEFSRRTSTYQKKSGRPKAYVANGTYANINNLLQREYKYYDMFPDEFPDNVLTMTMDAYQNYVREKYRLVIDSIEADKSLPVGIREYHKVQYAEMLLHYTCNAKRYYEQAYRKANNIKWEVRKLNYEAPVLKPEHLVGLNEIGINSNKMFYFSEFPFCISTIFNVLKDEEQLKKLLGTDRGLLFDLFKVQGIFERLENLEPLTAEQERNLASISDPFYREAFENMKKVIADKMEAGRNKEGYKICDIPVVADEQLFDAIMARYKGKVILVDYWATWCGPCRSAIKENEPLKEVLKGKDIVYVYLTGESSPKSTWLQMIPDIKGEHYRLPKKQWDAVGDKFNITGIPAYVLVDKTGKATLREDFHNVNKMKKVLLEECKK